MTTYETRGFAASDLDSAARLLADRHRRHRSTWPALNPAYEDPAATRSLIEELLEREGADGAIVHLDGRPAAYVIGSSKAPSWGPNIWIEDAGNAGDDPEAIRHGYAFAAQRWVDAGLTNHYVVVPTDDLIVDAWFSLSFGLQHVHALRAVVPADYRPQLPPGLIVRAADKADVPALVDLDPVLPLHARRSPVFSPVPIPTPEESLPEVEQDLDDPRFAPFVAEFQGRIVGTATAASLDVSNANTPLMRPVSCGFLGFAVVSPDARGLGAGRALADAVAIWSRDQGYEWLATDWRSTNIEANRTWRAAGYRPSFYRLFRSVA
jgi:GNAT superfamily N-acetyltransferase